MYTTQSESNAVVRAQLMRAIEQGLTIILCIGETERDQGGAYLSVITEQLSSALDKLPLRPASIAASNALTGSRRAAAISHSACQNSASSDTLVGCPEIRTERLTMALPSMRPRSPVERGFASFRGQAGAYPVDKSRQLERCATIRKDRHWDRGGFGRLMCRWQQSP